MKADKYFEPRIAIVCPACGGTGSVAGVALHHAIELSKYFRVTLVSDSFPMHGLAGVKFLEVTPRRFDYLRRFCHVPNEYSFAKSVRDSLEMMHKDKPINMVICHGHAVAALSAKPLKKKYGIPYALVTHGDIYDRPKATYDWRLTAFYKVVTPAAYGNADLVFAVSPHMAACAIRGGALPEAVKIVPNGIDPVDIGIDENTSTNREKKHSGPIRLLFVGRLSVEKGVDILIRACRILKERGVDFTLDIIGSGPLEKALRTMVSEAHLRDRITFLGKVERRLLGGHYRMADLVCVPSLSEPFGLVVLEALISGTSVIATEVGGIPLLVKEGTNGFLVSPGDYCSVADAVEELHKNRHKLEYLSSNARASVYPQFSWHYIGEQIVEFVKKTTYALAPDKLLYLISFASLLCSVGVSIGI